MSLRVLDTINFGYDALEPVILGLVALNKSFMLIGRHGTGKTRLARSLSRAFGDDAFVFYDATKDDLISIAGIPDPEGLKRGTLRFVPHERSIWNKATIVVDEITRAGKESQNLWLEILEQRTCFGLPLAYRTLIATANPESYAAAFQLDEALLDRFHAVIPVPEHQQGVSADDVKAMIALASRGERGGPEPETLARIFAEIQGAHETLLKEGAASRVADYVGKLVPSLLGLLKEQTGPYMSARTYARNLPETILAIAAYHKAAGSERPLQKAAVEALRYAVATKLQIKPALLDAFHQAASPLLDSAESGEGQRLRLELSAAQTFEQRIVFVQENWDGIKQSLAADEIEKIFGDLLKGASQKGEQEKLVELRDVVQKLGYVGDGLRQVDGRLLIALNGAVSAVMPRLRALLDSQKDGALKIKAHANIERFRQMVQLGVFVRSTDKEVKRLQKHLIDLKEGDADNSDASLFSFFASLELPEPKAG
ncbi:MAG: MoxR family ATPase [Deltaproteobacteria bacterium]|nr:MoxR family ATPase [Deltaproteobacteria bacterium]